jgi:hypothetical protein
LPIPTSPSHAFGAGPSLSALKGGEGNALVVWLQLLLDGLQHSREIVHHIIVPEPDHSIAAPRYFAGPRRVCLLLNRVLSAVEFDRQFSCGTGEIDDRDTDRMLATEAMLR